LRILGFLDAVPLLAANPDGAENIGAATACSSQHLPSETAFDRLRKL